MKFYFVLLLSFLFISFTKSGKSQAPTVLCQGSLGDPVVNITFGSGAPGSFGPQLQTTATGYLYQNANCIVDNHYEITNQVFGCFPGDWHDLPQDHTGDPGGYFMLIGASNIPSNFYLDTVKNLCPNTTYEFASWVSNMMLPSGCGFTGGLKPNITFSIEDINGNILGVYNTGDIAATNQPTWVQYGFYFTTPPAATSVVLRMRNNGPGGCGNDIALDDITFRACGPTVRASFSNISPLDTVRISEGTSTSMYGTITPGYNNPGFLWQRSTDNGNSWTDVPNSNNLNLNVTPNTSGTQQTYIYRLMAGESNNVNSTNCRVASNHIVLIVYPAPLTQLILCQGSLGDPVVNITFGRGNNPGPSLSTVVPGAVTTLTYVPVSGNPANPTPLDGQYTITNNVPYNAAWFSGASNHTPTDPTGYMAFYNSSEQPGEFYKETIGNLCGSTTYEFAAWIANALDPSKSIGVKPDITFVIEQTDGTYLASFDTGPINQTNVFTWQQYGFYFTTPPTGQTLVLRMINNSPGGNANVGNDLAIDDITFRACGPTTTASFNAATLLDSISVCGGSNITLYGKTISGYNNPGYLWQFSADSGKTWSDIASSNMLQLSFTAPSIAKNYKYRMLTGEGNNVTLSNCRVSSNETILNIKLPPQGKLTGNNICTGDIANLQFTSADPSPFSISYTDGTNTYTQNNLNSTSSFATPYILIDTTTFILTSISNGNGCTNSNPHDSAVTINVNPIPQGGITGGDNCEASPGLISFDITQGRPLFSLVITDGITDITLDGAAAIGAFSIPALSATKSYTLLSVTDKNGCKRISNFTSPTATINVIPAPKISFAALPAVCKNDSSFTITQASETSGIQGSGIFYGTGVSSTGFVDLSKISPGTYPITYRYTASNGCADSAIQPITIKSIPVANAGPDLLGCMNNSIQLSASGGEFYLWSPPTGLSDPTIPDPLLTINTTTTYILSVTNTEGCTSRDSLTITISPLGKGAYKVPNAFTPNGDGKNDCFGIQRWGGIDLKEFTVYNRWGQRIFSTKNPSVCWDGTFEGTPQDSGGFVYIIRALTPCGIIDLKGTVFLVR